MTAMALARDERDDFAELLQTLTPDQWASATLCSGWNVRELVAHVLSYEEHSTVDVLRRLRRARLRFGRLNEVALAEYDHLSPDELIAFLRRHLVPRGATASMGGRTGLVDALIHHQDVRRPLGLPREVPAERLSIALPFAVTAPPLRGFWRARGVRLRATDLDFEHGRGPEVAGPAEAVLMALAGRPAALGDLTGPGLARLRRNLT